MWLIPNEPCHQLESGICPKIAPERRRHQRRHHVGTCPGKLGGDGGEIDLRQGGDRQPQIAEQAAEHDGDPEQRRRDRGGG